jgi:hypothetical protein
VAAPSLIDALWLDDSGWENVEEKKGWFRSLCFIWLALMKLWERAMLF